jgi:hypothetical protein
MSFVDTAIVGAGPYGLSLAAHLRELGTSFQVLGTPMESWRSFMPSGMILKSEGFASNLWDPERQFTFERYLAWRDLPYRAVGQPVELSLFLQYAAWFCAHAVGEVRDVRVRRISDCTTHFELELSDASTLRARRVVLASGHMAFRHIPAELADIPEPLCLHSSGFFEIERFRGREVVVLGAGQSAIETAALLHEVGSKVTLVARTGALKWNGGPLKDPNLIDHIREPEAGLGRGWRSLAISELPFLFRTLFEANKRHRYVKASWGPSGAWWLRERFEGRVASRLARELRAARVAGERVEIDLVGPSGSETIAAHHVISATGFKVDIARLTYLDEALRGRIACEAPGIPALSSHFETSVRGLYVIGIASAPVFGPVMRFMFGAKHSSPHLASWLARHAAREGSHTHTSGLQQATK